MVSGGHGERLSRQQEQAVAVLLVTPNYREAAALLKVHENTLRTWSKQPAFAAAFESARKELLSKTIAKLHCAVFKVVDALESDLSNRSPGVRHRAAELLLDATLRGTELLNLNQRIADLEGVLNGGKT